MERYYHEIRKKSTFKVVVTLTISIVIVAVSLFAIFYLNTKINLNEKIPNFNYIVVAYLVFVLIIFIFSVYKTIREELDVLKDRFKQRIIQRS